MPESVSIIVPDGLVIVDGEALEAAYAYPEAVRAVQWRNGVGHVEFDDGRPNLEFMAEGDDVGDTYREYVLPGIRAFERERKRLDAEAEAAEAVRLAEYNGTEARSERVRAERDARLAACAWLVERHRDQLASGGETTLTDAGYLNWLAYRQALRDLPQQPGFPWEGPDDPVCPWPAEPANVCAPVPHSCDAEGALQSRYQSERTGRQSPPELRRQE